MDTAADIRRTFLDFFGAHDHAHVSSSNLVPRNDPSLLFTNSGMVQFKNIFTGLDSPPTPPRAVTAQKCLRAGGKHNDLENVGYTARHHTFFEMLGNFSFGDYFKDRAIELAWALVTQELGLDKSRLLVTVYGEDEQARTLWKKIAGLDEGQIIAISTDDNFWQMGDEGPCGPCSEIFYDHGPDMPGGPPGSPDEDGDRFVEIWNLVFMEFEQTASQRKSLPRPSIDTGMGLERMAAVLQGKHTNYDVDHIRALVDSIAGLTDTDPDGVHAASHRVVADHVRAAGFLIAEGVLPSNEGRGYVLRRIMRRAMRHAHLLGAHEPVVHKLVAPLVQSMGAHYTELQRAHERIEATICQEERSFQSLLERGLVLLNTSLEDVRGGTLAGEVAFKLYDTFGFPLDLTEDIVRGRKLSVDRTGFEACMEAQRQRARAAWKGSGDSSQNALWLGFVQDVEACEFLGYEALHNDALVLALATDEPCAQMEEGMEGVLIASQTPFYGEAGGQIGDAGTITGPQGCFEVMDTQKLLVDQRTIVVHKGRVGQGCLRTGEAVTLRVDGARRGQIAANHSATHLVHAALRSRLGEQVTQRGSWVGAEMMRFDFTCDRRLEIEDLRQLEQTVNAQIRANTAVTTGVMPLEDALESGAMALFGEKYGAEVRVVRMGDAALPSLELCGGTHVASTGAIGSFAIAKEQGVASGVRRIVCLTGVAAQAVARANHERVAALTELLKVPETELLEQVTGLVQKVRELQKASARGKHVRMDSERIGELEVLSQLADDIPVGELKRLVDEAKAKDGERVVLLISTEGGKVSLAAGVTEGLCATISAIDLVRAGSAACGGEGGGGRPDMARAGGPDPARAPAALAAMRALLVP